MRLYEALGISPGETAAFTGAGGKSSAIVQLCRELSSEGLRVLAVPTTKMFVSEAERIGPLVTDEDTEKLRGLVAEALPKSGGAIVVGSGGLSKERISGVEPEAVPALARLADVTLVEADGSRRRPLKGTADHEPAMPEGATLTVAVGGGWALGHPLDEETVHRPELFSELTGISPGQTITPESFALALAKGSLKGTLEGMAEGAVEGTAEGSRRVALITGVQPGPGMSGAAVIAHELWRLGIRKVVLTSLPFGDPPTVWNA